MDIKRLRKKIDEMDRRIVRTLSQRAKVAMQVGEAKRRTDAAVLAPAREEEVLARVERLAREAGVLPPEAVRAIYREIISACRAAERTIKVAFLGPRGTFSHHAAKLAASDASLSRQAAQRHFGSSVELLPVSDIDAVFAEVSQGRADLGVVPIENTTGGGVSATLDMFMATDLKVCGEINVRVRHSLLAKCAPRNIRKIYSKAEVFAQCKAWLANHYPEARLIEAASTGHAAETAARSNEAAAIAHEEAAAINGLRVLHRAIEDNPFNITRFYVIAPDAAQPTGRDKTSILCFIKDQPGALYHILLPFWRDRVNLTRIESRPSRVKAWDYCFFIDFEGHSGAPKIARTLDKVKAKCNHMKVLGSYPVGR